MLDHHRPSVRIDASNAQVRLADGDALVGAGQTARPAQPDGRFRVLVTEPETISEADEPWPDDGFVRFGAAAQGWVLLETVPLGYELWRQLNNFPPRYTGPENGAGEGA